MDDPDLSGVQPELLAGMLRSDGGSYPWDADDLSAVLEHQLAAPLRFDLEGEGLGSEERQTPADGAGSPIASFAELFRHPRPPLELLQRTKRFAKASRNHPCKLLPEPVAGVLYLLSIAAALVRCRCRITALSDASLRRGIRWALEQPWLDAASRALLEDGRNHLEERGESKP